MKSDHAALAADMQFNEYQLDALQSSTMLLGSYTEDNHAYKQKIIKWGNIDAQFFSKNLIPAQILWVVTGSLYSACLRACIKKQQEFLYDHQRRWDQFPMDESSETLASHRLEWCV